MTKMCVGGGWRAEEAGGAPGIQNQKQEPHTKLWGKMYKAHHVRTTFGRSDLVSRGRRKGLCTFSKVSKT